MGSGGFNLIGKGVRAGGSLWPWALCIAAALMMGSAFTYTGAFERFKNNTSESDIIRSVLGPAAEWIGSAAILVYNIVSIVVILVFCSKLLLPTSSWLTQVTLTLFILASMASIALLGIDVNKEVINVVTWGLIGFLCTASALGGYGVATLPSQPSPSSTGFMTSLWMFVFVLIGFDALMKFAEETKDEADIPNSFYLSNIISTVLTAGVAVAIAVWLPGLTGAQEGLAIELLFAKFLGGWAMEPLKWLVLVFLLLAAFVVFLSVTRYLYGLGDKSDIIGALKLVNEAKAPWVSIATIFGSGSILALLNNTEMLVIITDLGFAVIATLVAGSVTIADWDDGKIGSAALSGATTAGFAGLIASAFF